jgi:hypothetical protein
MLSWNPPIQYADATYADIADDWGLWCMNLDPDGEGWHSNNLVLSEEEFYEHSIEAKITILIKELGPE